MHIHRGKAWLSTAVKGFLSQVSASHAAENISVTKQSRSGTAPEVCSGILFGYIRHVVKQHHGAVYVIHCPLYRPRLETPKQMLTNVVHAR